MVKNNKPVVQANIEVITLDDGDDESGEQKDPVPSTSQNRSSSRPACIKTPKSNRIVKKTKKLIRSVVSRRSCRKTKPLSNIINNIQDHLRPVDSKSRNARTPKSKGKPKSPSGSTATGASSASSGYCSNEKRNELIDLDSDDDFDEISIIEEVEKDCHTLSFMNANSSKVAPLPKVEEVAVIEHIQQEIESRKKLKHPVGHAVVYTDGSCREYFRTGEQVAGIGVFWAPDDKRNVSQLISGLASANRAEIQAAICAIKTAIDYKYEFVTVYTDSIYLIEGVKRFMNRRMPRTERCRSDFAELAPLLRKIQVKLKKVPAHKGIRGNEYADQLAKEITRLKIKQMCAHKRYRVRF